MGYSVEYVGYNKIYDTSRYSINLSSNKIADSIGGSFNGHSITWENYREMVEKLTYARDNVFEFNDCSKANTNSGDCGPIYFWGASTGNNIVRNNSVHDSDTVRDPNNRYSGDGFGIYLDDGSDYFTIENNLVHHMYIEGSGKSNHFGTLMVKGEGNVIKNNLMAANNIGTVGSKDGGGGGVVIQQLGSQKCQTQGNLMQNNILYDTYNVNGGSHDTFRYSDGANPQRPTKERLNTDYNLFYNTDGSNFNVNYCVDENGNSSYPTVDGGWKSNLKLDVHSITHEDPQIMSVKDRDFRLRYTSPAYQIGYQDINIGDIGLKSDFPFSDSSDAISEVFVRQKGIDIDYSWAKLVPGDTLELTTFARTTNGYFSDLTGAEIVYTVADPEIASVTQNGMISAHANGSTYLTVSVTKEGTTVTTILDIVVQEGEITPTPAPTPTPTPSPTPTPTPVPTPTPDAANRHEFYDDFEAGVNWHNLWIDENTGDTTRSFYADSTDPSNSSGIFALYKSYSGDAKTYRDFTDSMIQGDANGIYTIKLKVKPEDNGNGWRFKLRLGSNPDVSDVTGYEEPTLFSISGGKLVYGQGNNEIQTGVSVARGIWNEITVTVDNNIGVYSVAVGEQTAIHNHDLGTQKYQKGFIIYNNGTGQTTMKFDDIRAFSGIAEPLRALDSNPLFIDGIKLYDRDGTTQLDALYSNSIVRLNCKIGNTSGIEGLPVNIIIAIYRENGSEMTEYYLKTQTLGKGLNEYSTSFRLPSDVQNSDKVRVFVWDETWNTLPLAAAKEWRLAS